MKFTATIDSRKTPATAILVCEDDQTQKRLEAPDRVQLRDLIRMTCKTKVFTKKHGLPKPCASGFCNGGGYGQTMGKVVLCGEPRCRDYLEKFIRSPEDFEITITEE